MKGLALLRSGKTTESEALMDEIVEAKPADDPTLQAMTICYREMQKRKNYLKNTNQMYMYSWIQSMLHCLYLVTAKVIDKFGLFSLFIFVLLSNWLIKKI